jgi:hypothetical protein
LSGAESVTIRNKALEAKAMARGNKRCTLTSTETAHRFYQKAHYVDDDAPTGEFGTSSGYPMSKQLVGTPWFGVKPSW